MGTTEILEGKRILAVDDEPDVLEVDTGTASSIQSYNGFDL